MGTRFQQSAGIEFAPLQDEVILFHSPSNKFCVLNRTSSFIWSQLKEPATSEEIARRLEGSFSEVDSDQARSDIDAALQQMLELGLIVSVNGSSHPNEVNR
jgi:PqqD family protein of HPr-rel-A system